MRRFQHCPILLGLLLGLVAVPILPGLVVGPILPGLVVDPIHLVRLFGHLPELVVVPILVLLLGLVAVPILVLLLVLGFVPIHLVLQLVLRLVDSSRSSQKIYEKFVHSLK